MKKPDLAHRNYVDSYGYLLEASRPWGEPEERDDRKGDAVANTTMAAITYREQRFIHAPWNNFTGFLLGGKWNPIRHPNTPRRWDFSRDHTVWFVIWLRYFFPSYLSAASRIPWKVSEKHSALGIWLWLKLMGRGRWVDYFAYWAVHGAVMRFNNRWNRFLRARALITSVHYSRFKKTEPEVMNKRELFARKNSVPAYSFDTQAFMVHCMKDGWFKSRLKKRVIPLVEKTNYLVRRLMDDTFHPWEMIEVENYTGMDSNRWARRLDATTDIVMSPLVGPQPEYNINVDILHADLSWE